ncbi:Inositol-1,4,5-trisphosphate 5-phosphatase 1 [Ophidiomyces ophidiicola]|uniref:Inositol-1,4,5-trisphosphate 5-phosphatase 1 n=1 Tax=Ophidiomyces ophidiicola TaxID=1387563 RepID=UPI0020C2FE30|nr:Inositol-1,4,5-trisphosphate 5-phosphatase 1 [Ophidiomyces ophidiicola]KAI1942334.1 Inositol-1,4,5-trisphosphate 5-phosphatase 1 [Ophidiomyces ophidiicola]
MSIQVLCKDQPQRCITLVTKDGHALVLEYSSTFSEPAASLGSYPNIEQPKCIVTFLKAPSINSLQYRCLGTGYGTLGLLTLNSDVFLCVIRNSTMVATPLPNETVRRIEDVDFYCLNRPDYDMIMDVYGQSTEEGFLGNAFQGRDAVTENPFLSLKKLLSDGSFYYSTDFDLTSRLQDRINEKSFDVERFDKDFLWNSYMIDALLQFRSGLTDHERQQLDSSQMITFAIRGFARSFEIKESDILVQHGRERTQSCLTVISRLSSRRAGTRFNSRGLDDDGQVSNFVESETILWNSSGITFSFTQVRGSVPIFWEQSAVMVPGQQKIQVTRSTAATQHAFDKHFDSLQLDYGAVHVVNLLSESKPGEVELSQRYRYHMNHSPLRKAREEGTTSAHHLLQWTDFDFHAETKGPEGYARAKLIEDEIDGSIDGFEYFLSNAHDDTQTVVLQQGGVFRTNCLDCLDRTNLVQTIISYIALERFYERTMGITMIEFDAVHSVLWADNGDMLSKIYAGTGALKSSFTRHGKMSIAGTFADVRKTFTRLYVSNFADDSRQYTIDVLLGTLTGQAAVHLFDPVSDLVRSELAGKLREFTFTKTVRIWAGTFNANGLQYNRTEDLGVWLHAHITEPSEEPAIVAVGLQEIVELNPQQIMSTDPGSLKTWEEEVRNVLDKETSRRGTVGYVLLRSGQLVGAALLLFVKRDTLPQIKNVEGSVKKTGLSGMAGNKGACAIRLELSNTRICFVSAHLAAGFSNYEERNSDYNTIAHGLRFQRNRSISDHDAIFWLGDFNYRIGLSDGEVRSLIDMGNLDTLLAHDQLLMQMRIGHIFPNYSEGPITFLPTYRYNNGTDIYDTSEKRRVPAWCDRILWRGKNLRQLEYNTAPLMFSDHRPVYAVFICPIRVVDEEQKERLSHELHEKYKVTSSQINTSDTASSTIGASSTGSYHRKWSSIYQTGSKILTEKEKPVTFTLNSSSENSSLYGCGSKSPAVTPLRRMLINDPFGRQHEDVPLIPGSNEPKRIPEKSQSVEERPLVVVSDAPKRRPPVPKKPPMLANQLLPRNTFRINHSESSPSCRPVLPPRQQVEIRPILPSRRALPPTPTNRPLPVSHGKQQENKSKNNSTELLDLCVDSDLLEWVPLEPGR